MPNPGQKETKDEFINRCMSDLVGNENKDKAQAYAICISKWENKNMSKLKDDGKRKRRKG